MPVNNIEIVRNLIHFELEGDVYFAEVIARGKDFGKTGETLIRDFRIHNFEHFDEVMPTIIELCDHYHARCYFRLNQRNTDELNSHLKIAMEEQELCRKQAIRKFIKNGCDRNRVDKLPRVTSGAKLYASVMGKFSSETRETRKWIIDVDAEENRTLDEVEKMYTDAVLACGGKILARIPSRTGMHLVINTINKSDFAKIIGSAKAINEDGNTNLYIGD